MWIISLEEKVFDGEGFEQNKTAREKQAHCDISYLVLHIKIEKILILACISKSMCAFNDVMVLFLTLKCVIKLIMHLTIRHILNRENVVKVRKRQTKQSHQFSGVLDCKGLGRCCPLQQLLTMCGYGAPETWLVQNEGAANVKNTHQISKGQYALTINKACKIAHWYFSYQLHVGQKYFGCIG